jgi:hypothetical protein
MPATHEIHWDTDANRLEFTLTGIFDPSSFQKWDAAFRAAVAQAPRANWTTLADMTKFPPQPDAIQKGAEAHMAYGFAHGCTKSVIIAPKTVIAMPAKRLANDAGAAARMAFVATREEARLARRPPRVSPEVEQFRHQPRSRTSRLNAVARLPQNNHAHQDLEGHPSDPPLAGLGAPG